MEFLFIPEQEERREVDFHQKRDEAASLCGRSQSLTEVVYGWITQGRELLIGGAINEEEERIDALCIVFYENFELDSVFGYVELSWELVLHEFPSLTSLVQSIRQTSSEDEREKVFTQWAEKRSKAYSLIFNDTLCAETSTKEYTLEYALSYAISQGGETTLSPLDASELEEMLYDDELEDKAPIIAARPVVVHFMYENPVTHAGWAETWYTFLAHNP